MSDKITKILLSTWLALFTFAVLLTVKIADPYLIESMRLKFYDYLMLDKPISADDIVLVNIDEAALDKYGQYPFPRNVYADIIKDIYDSNPAVIANTILFLDPDRFKTDSVLAKAMEQYPLILAQTVGNCKRNNTSTKRTGVAIIGDGKSTDFLHNYPCVLDNIPVLQDAAIGVGITSTLPELDGVVRRIPMLAISNGEYYPAFALEILRAAAGESSYQAKITESGVEAVRIPQFATITTDAYSRVFVNWNYKFKEFSVAEPLPDLSGKIVILGVTAAGIANPVPTPAGSVYPHAVQATLLHTLLQGDSVAIPAWGSMLDYCILVVLSLAIIFLSRFKYSLVYIVALLGMYVYAPVYIFAHNKILFDITFNMFSLLIIYLHVYTVKFISEYLQKMQIKKQFQSYLSPAMVEKLQKNPELLALGGDSRELSIMFTDVRGFTSISEHYGKDVQGLTKIMNRYMTAMTSKIIYNNGTLDKYIGDAQMAFWNAPLDEMQHRRYSLRTALQMLGDLNAFNESIRAEGVPPFGMGLGINTDTVVVGNMGSDQRFDYTCLGDGVNLAARLEGQSKDYGVKIVLGHNTVQGIEDEFFILEMDMIAVKGKKEGVRIYTCLGYNTDYDKFRMELKMHKNMLADYRSRRFNSCISTIEKLQDSFNGDMRDYYAMMKKRCENYAANLPPADWDTIYRATSK